MTQGSKKWVDLFRQPTEETALQKETPDDSLPIEFLTRIRIWIDVVLLAKTTKK